MDRQWIIYTEYIVVANGLIYGADLFPLPKPFFKLISSLKTRL